MLAGLDLRGVLNYVEQFNKENFLFILEESCLEEAWLSGFLLDLDRLLGVGVGCLVCVNSTLESAWVKLEKLLLESSVAFDFLKDINSPQAQKIDWKSALARGQIIVTKGVISDKHQIEKVCKKLIWIDAHWPRGLTREQLVQRAIFLGAHTPAQADCDDGKLAEAKLWCEIAKIPRVHFLTTTQEDSLLEELFSAEGVGVMVYTNPYEEIRPLHKQEIVELLALMGPVISRQALLPRNYAEIENRIDDYLALVVDQHVLGCIAVHHYEPQESSEQQIAEIACLFIKPSHQNQGYAKKLIYAAECKAQAMGATTLVAMTKTAEKLFLELHYEQGHQAQLPKTMKSRSAADKKFFIKKLIKKIT